MTCFQLSMIACRRGRASCIDNGKNPPCKFSSGVHNGTATGDFLACQIGTPECVKLAT